MAVERFHGMRVLRRYARASTIGATHDQRNGEHPTGHVAHFWGIGYNLIEGHEAEIPAHEFDDGTQSAHCGANAHTSKARFSNRGVSYALRAEDIQQTFGYFVGAIIFGDFFAHDENTVITVHFFKQRLA